MKITGNHQISGASILDHSCDYNAIWACYGTELRIRTIEKVEKFSDLRVTYITNLEDTISNRNEDLKPYYFECNCQKCQNTELDARKSSMNCQNCANNGYIPISTKICQNCNYKPTSEEIEKYQELKFKIQTALENTNLTKNYQSLLKQGLTTFHPLDSTFQKFVELALNNADMEEKRRLKILQFMLENFSQTLNPYDPNVGMRNYEAANVCVALDKFEQAKNHIEKAEDIFKVTLGPDHAFLGKCQKVRDTITSIEDTLKELGMSK